MKNCKVIRLGLLTALALTMGGGALADPVNYWNAQNGSSISDASHLKLDDGSTAAWEDGNWLFAGSSGCGGYPSWAGTDFNYRTISIDKDVEAYGVKYFSGGSDWKGAGLLSIGAGGYDTTTSPMTTGELYAFDTHGFSMKGVHLTASQTWTNWTGSVRFKCPVTAAEGVTDWALVTPKKPKWGSLTCKTKVAAACDLSGVKVTLRGYEGLLLETADATLNADVLRIEGANAHLVYAEAGGSVVDSRYAKSLEFADGAKIRLSQEITIGTNSYKEEPLDGVVFDLDAIRVVSGATAIGDGYSYSVKDGGDLAVDVAAGATLTVASKPTSGRLVLTGAGEVALSSVMGASVDFSRFTGTVLQTGWGKVASLGGTFPGAALTLSNAVLRIDDVAGYAKALTVLGESRVALPRTADWPEGMALVASEKTVVYLPNGEEVDESKISGGTVLAVGRGMTAEGDVSVSTGEELVICGDGFAGDATITLNGGTVVVPFDVEIGAKVFAATHSTFSVSDRATATASGDWEWKKNQSVWLTISNLNYVVGSEVCNGRLKLTGSGSAFSGKFRQIGGDLEFSGPNCRWSFGKDIDIDFRASVGKYYGLRRLSILDGAQVTFAGKESSRGGIDFSTTAADMVHLVIGEGSLLELGENRSLSFGSSRWRCCVTLDVDGGTLRLRGAGAAFGTGGKTALQMTDADDGGWVQFNVFVTNGGVIETDRVFSATPVKHGNDAGTWGTDWPGCTITMPAYTPGVFMTLDGGTYRVGEGFGLSPLAENANTAKSRNVLFAGVTNVVTDAEALPDYTAEVMVTVGANGGTIDLSRAQAGVTSVTNTILGAPVPAPNVTGGYAPTLGPRWTLDGTLTVKGRGGQELVVNGLDAAALKKLRADGAVLKVVSDNAAALDEMTLGSPAGGGLVVETTAAETPERLAVSIASLAVAADGFFDAACFDVERTTVGEMSFGEGATICASADPLATLRVTGAATLASQMGYWAASRGAADGAVVSAGAVVVPEGGVAWTKREGSRNRRAFVTATEVGMKKFGAVLIVR